MPARPRRSEVRNRRRVASPPNFRSEGVRELTPWLRWIFPRSRALFLGAPSQGREWRVLATDRLPTELLGREVVLPPPAKRNRDAHIGYVSAATLGSARPFGLSALQGVDQWSVIFPVPIGDVGAVTLYLPAQTTKGREERQRLRTLVRLSRTLSLSHGASRSEVRAAVSAKLQLEATVDLLPEIICLLDRKRRILRINRTIERWRLSTVRDARETELHGLLHPQCSNAACALLVAVDRVWARAARSTAAQEEITDTLLGRTLSITVRRMVHAKRGREADGRSYAACVLADVTALAAAQRQLRQANEMLEARVLTRTEALERTNAELKQQIVRRELVERELLESRSELSMLSVELMHAQEAERQRIARELHDAVGQSLSAVKYTLERSQKLLENPNLGSMSQAIELALERVHATISDVRTISSSLRPPLLDDIGPTAAISNFCREWTTVYPHIELTLALDVEDQQIPPVLGLSLFRIVQEALNNVAKHADAQHVGVALSLRNGRLTVSVEDDGVGLPLRSRGQLVQRGSGLRGMRERAEHDGGQFHLESAARKGTRLSVVWNDQELSRLRPPERRRRSGTG